MYTKDAFLLITCKGGNRNQIKENVEKLDGVKEVIMTNGVYDLVTKIESDSPNHLKYLRERIQYIDNVNSLLTLQKVPRF